MAQSASSIFADYSRTAASVASGAVACPSGEQWASAGGKCYREPAGEGSLLTFDECVTACEAAGASLPCVTDACHNQWLSALTPARTQWLGLYEDAALQPAEWRFDDSLRGWVGGHNWVSAQCTSTFHDWRTWREGTGKPNDEYFVQESCAVLSDSRPWNDQRCSSRHACVCEYPGGAHKNASRLAEVRARLAATDELLPHGFVLIAFCVVCAVLICGSAVFYLHRLSWARVRVVTDAAATTLPDGPFRTRKDSKVSNRVAPSPSEAEVSYHDQRVQTQLMNGTLRLVRCDWLRELPPEHVLPRRQELPAEAFLSAEEAAAVFIRRDRSVCALSYGWLSALHPDPHGLHLQLVQDFLKSETGRHFEAIFWDWVSCMQKDAEGVRTPSEAASFARALSVMAGFYASARGTSVLLQRRIPEPPDGAEYTMTEYDGRGWCKFEMYAGMISAGAALSGDASTEVMPPKLLDAASHASIEVEDVPEPQEFDEEIESTRFVGKGDKERVKEMYLSFYLSVGTLERARVRLQAQLDAADRRRRAMRQSVVSVLLVLFGATLGVYTSLHTGLLHQETGHAAGTQFSAFARAGAFLAPWYWCASCAAFLLQLLVRPTDQGLIIVSLFAQYLASLGFAITFLVFAWRPLGGNYINSSINVVKACIFSLSVVALTRYLPLVEDERFSREHVHRMIWRKLKFEFFCLGGAELGLTVARIYASPWDPIYILLLSVPILFYILTALSFAKVRGRIVTAFARGLASPLRICAGRSSNSDGQGAAIAALIGVGNADMQTASEALERGKRLFRLIPFSQLAVTDLAGVTDAAAAQSEEEGESAALAELRAKAFPAMLGAEGSFFVSHSWHDSRDGKWEALKTWAEAETEESGESPLLWLDTACSPERFEDHIACTPIFTAGCQRFLVLAGNTYAQRLWAVTELFCFLKNAPVEVRLMHHVLVLPIKSVHNTSDAAISWTIERARSRFRKFDVRDATCARERDRVKLLACIEAGFGSFEPFNHVVQTIFTERLVDVSNASSKRASASPSVRLEDASRPQGFLAALLKPFAPAGGDAGQARPPGARRKMAPSQLGVPRKQSTHPPQLATAARAEARAEAREAREARRKKRGEREAGAPVV